MLSVSVAVWPLSKANEESKERKKFRDQRSERPAGAFSSPVHAVLHRVFRSSYFASLQINFQLQASHLNSAPSAQHKTFPTFTISVGNYLTSSDNEAVTVKIFVSFVAVN